MIDEKRLNEIEARSNATGAEPWKIDTETYDEAEGVIFCMIDGDVKCVAVFGDPQDGCGEEDENNAAFAAAAHTDVPDLVAEVRRQRKILDVWSNALAEIHLSHPHIVDEDTLMAKGDRHSAEVQQLREDLADTKRAFKAWVEDHMPDTGGPQ